MDFAAIDYCTIRLRSFDTAEDVINHFLGLAESDFIKSSGRYGYNEGFQHGNIHVYYGGREEMGICVEISGQGCREYITQRNDDYAILKLFACMDEDDDVVTRIDIAFDDKGGQLLSFDAITSKIESGEVRTKLRSRSEFIQDGGVSGHSLYFGSRNSDYYVRIYDKAAEQKLISTHWLRVEQVFRHEDADSYVRYCMHESEKRSSIEEKYKCFFSVGASILMGKLAFVAKHEGKNSSRWPVCAWWEQFLNGALPITIKRTRTSPTVQRAKKWIEKSVESTLGALLMILGPEWAVKMIQRSIDKCAAGSRYITLSDAWKAVGNTPAMTWSEHAADDFLSQMAAEINSKGAG